jgi:hypothetical protein
MYTIGVCVGDIADGTDTALLPGLSRRHHLPEHPLGSALPPVTGFSAYFLLC